MTKSPIHIKFQNSQNPNAGFDLIRLEELFNRNDLDHSIEQLHLVEFYIVLFITKGQGRHTIDFTDYTCSKGTVLTVRKDQLHHFFVNKSIEGYMLLFTDAFLISYLEKLESLKSLRLFNESLGVPKVQLSNVETKEVVDLIERMKKEYFEVNDDYSLGIIRSELQILIAKLYRMKSQKSQVVQNRKHLSAFIDFQKLVEENASKTTKVQDYAKMMGLSTKTLNTITKSIVNKTAKGFVDDICTIQIKRLLINTELSIKEVAYASGFEETTNFYKYFKRQLNTTPEQFRTTF